MAVAVDEDGVILGIVASEDISDAIQAASGTV
jgi:hypothetical protein